MGGRFPGSRNATIREGVGCLPLFGPVFPRANMMTEMSGATSLAELAADFRKLEASAEVHHILIVADSPGGQITDVRAFAQLIANSSKPVTVFVSGLRCKSEEHTSELQSLMRISYAVFCVKQKKYTLKQY